jgi:3-oxoacyl-[acyl-carrier protein] reductase
MPELDGKIALVTGGSRGIGAAICAELGVAGATVVVNYVRDESAAAEVCERVRSAGGSAEAVQGDVSSAEGAAALVSHVESEIGPIGVLVNNAGITRDDLIMRLSEDDWRTVIDTNLGGAFFTCRALSRPMLKRRSGAIVNISSIVGVHGNAGQTNYAASKAGTNGFTRSLAREVGRYGIRANVVAPGFVESDMVADLTGAVRQQAEQGIALGRFGEPGHVADAVSFLVSDRAVYITGAVLQVDGGIRL